MQFPFFNGEGFSVKRIAFFCVAVALATCQVLGGASVATAGTIVEATVNGTWADSVPSPIASGVGDVASGSGTVGGVSINVLTAVSNSPGAPTGALLFGSTAVLVNTNAFATTVTLALGSNGFTAPLAPPAGTLTSHIGGSSTIGTTSTVSFQSFLAENNLAGHLGTGAGATYASLPVQTPSLAPGSYNSTVVTNGLTPITAPFALNELVTFTLAAGDTVNFSSQTTLTTPEPASIVLLGLGAAGMAGYGLKRRKVTA